MGKTPYGLGDIFHFIVSVMADKNNTHTTHIPEQAGGLSPCQTPQPHRILVVDDDRYLCHINAMVLHHAGYHVDTVEDGASGWSALKASRYDVLITDNSMPGMTGMELIKKVRFEEMPLLVILAHGMALGEKFSRYLCLVDATLLKPYTAEVMLATVNKILHQANGNAVSSQVLNGHDLISQARETGEVASMPAHCETGPRRRILVVEEEPDLRRLNAEVLKRSGYDVDIAEDGNAGWKALHAVRHAPESYDLLITDHEMPGLTGLALIQKARAASIALPVIMATGRLLPEEVFSRYPWLQPVAMLPKPYSVEQLLGTVEAVLRIVNGDRRQIVPPRYGPSTGRLWL